jgi:hypothetical protein
MRFCAACDRDLKPSSVSGFAAQGILLRMVALTLAPEPTRTPAKAIAIAIVVMVLIAAATWWWMPHGVAKISVMHDHLVSPHIVNKAMPGSGMKVVGTQASEEDSLYAAEDLHIEDLQGVPLFITGMTAEAIWADGTESDATVVTPPDFSRITPSFPALAPLLTHPLALDATVPPKGSLDGTVLLLFAGQTDVAWKAKKSARLTLLFAHHDPQTINLP